MIINKSRKGAITSILVDFWMYLAFVLVVIVFYLIFSAMSKDVADKQITGLETKAKAYTNLLNYLKTPVIVDGKETDIAGLIRLWHNEPDKYKELLEKTSIGILNDMEYDYDNPIKGTGNRLVRGFYISINSEKKENGGLYPLLEFQSKCCESGFTVRDESGVGLIAAEQFVPVSEDKYLYVVMMERAKAK